MCSVTVAPVGSSPSLSTQRCICDTCRSVTLSRSGWDNSLPTRRAEGCVRDALKAPHTKTHCRPASTRIRLKLSSPGRIRMMQNVNQVAHHAHHLTTRSRSYTSAPRKCGARASDIPCKVHAQSKKPAVGDMDMPSVWTPIKQARLFFLHLFRVKRDLGAWSTYTMITGMMTEISCDAVWTQGFDFTGPNYRRAAYRYHVEERNGRSEHQGCL